jgi:hypothetical protein
MGVIHVSTSGKNVIYLQALGVQSCGLVGKLSGLTDVTSIEHTFGCSDVVDSGAALQVRRAGMDGELQTSSTTYNVVLGDAGQNL